MSEVCSDKVTSARIFSHSSDPSDSDYIQNHIDSFFPSDDFTKEVIDEDNENPSGAVVSIISGEVDADEAEKILDLLLYSGVEGEESGYTVIKRRYKYEC